MDCLLRAHATKKFRAPSPSSYKYNAIVSLAFLMLQNSMYKKKLFYAGRTKKTKTFCPHPVRTYREEALLQAQKLEEY